MPLEKNGVCSYLLIRLVLCFSEEADVLDESGLDVFVVHKLAENVKLLTQELVGEIHLPKVERRCASDEGEGTTLEATNPNGDVLKTVHCLSCKLTVVFIMPVPWVRMELAM